MRPGILALYRALLANPDPLPASDLRPCPGMPDSPLRDEAQIGLVLT